MKTYIVLVNGSEVGTVEAPSYHAAKAEARRAFHRRCDVIGLR